MQFLAANLDIPRHGRMQPPYGVSTNSVLFDNGGAGTRTRAAYLPAVPDMLVACSSRALE